MKKREIIDIMYRSAQLFEQNLKNKNLLIIYGNVNLPKIIETRAAEELLIKMRVKATMKFKGHFVMS